MILLIFYKNIYLYVGNEQELAAPKPPLAAFRAGRGGVSCVSS